MDQTYKDLLEQYVMLLAKYDVEVSVDNEEDLRYSATREKKVVLTSEMTVEEIARQCYYTLDFIIDPDEDDLVSMADVFKATVDTTRQFMKGD